VYPEESITVGTHEVNPLLRPFKKLLRRKRKYMPAQEAAEWREKAQALYAKYGIEFHPLQTDASMVPPAKVVSNVQGKSKSDPNTFLGSGYRDMVRYITELEDHGGDIGSMKRMCDFGFGTGRVLLQFLPFDMELFGCDANQPSVDWTRSTLSEFAELHKTEFDPPLPFEADFLDLVISNSVFTHIPYADMRPWIEELARIVKSGGFVLATIHDFDKMPESALEKGWYEKGNERGFHNNTYLTHEKLVEIWQPEFEVLDVRRYPPGQAHVVIRRN
jgi:SAM-dependent methyltransferase